MASAKSVTYGVSYLSLQKLPHHQVFTTKPNESYVQLHPTPPRPPTITRHVRRRGYTHASRRPLPQGIASLTTSLWARSEECAAIHHHHHH